MTQYISARARTYEVLRIQTLSEEHIRAIVRAKRKLYRLVSSRLVTRILISLEVLSKSVVSLLRSFVEALVAASNDLVASVVRRRADN